METYTPPTISKMLHVSRHTVMAWIRRGELKASNLASKTATRPRFRVTKEALEEFLSDREVTPAPEPVRRRRRPRRVPSRQYV